MTNIGTLDWIVIGLTRLGVKGYTTNFDDLGQLDGSCFDQIPGLASQLLMQEDYAEIAGIELVRIGKDTTITSLKQELRTNEVYYLLNKALC